MSQATSQTTNPATRQQLKRRLRSLDIYRGLIMITLIFSGFGLLKTARNLQEVEATTIIGQGEFVREIQWDVVEHQFSHVQWVGYGFWDMIQPSFMFMVGVSMAFSYAKRKGRGDNYFEMLFHAFTRSILLVFLGIFLISNGTSTNWSLMNVLTQIGLGYTFLFLFWKRGFLIQSIGVVVLLAVTFSAYRFASNVGVPETGFESIGLNQQWIDDNLEGVAPWWHKNANLGHQVDLWLLNAFGQTDKLFSYNKDGYQTFNFIPSLATMLLGLICGDWLKLKRSSWINLLQFLALGAVCIIAGYALHMTDICPLIKRIWTPSWTLFSGGICIVTLATLYLLFDMLPLGVLGLPATVVGTNSIVAYCMYSLLRPWTTSNLERHFGDKIFQLQPQIGYKMFSPYPFDRPPDFFAQYQPQYQPMCEAIMVGLCFWIVCLWMYRRKLFVRI
jgi:predicted acyltransferase